MSKPENVKCPICGFDMRPAKSKHGHYWRCKKWGCEGTRDDMGMSKEDKNLLDEADED